VKLDEVGTRSMQRRYQPSSPRIYFSRASQPDQDTLSLAHVLRRTKQIYLYILIRAANLQFLLCSILVSSCQLKVDDCLTIEEAS